MVFKAINNNWILKQLMQEVLPKYITNALANFYCLYARQTENI